MNLLTRLQVWWRRRKLKKAAKNQQAPPLREFVYLDEVSVYSLNASRLGSVAADFTETRSSSVQSELSGSIGAGAVGTPTAGLNSRLLSGQSRESQATRTATVQSAFKELYEFELELDSFAMSPVPERLDPPSTKDFEALRAETQKAGPNSWVVDPEALRRGRLVEAEVELEADATFRASAVISAFVGMAESEPGMFGDVKDALAQGKGLRRIIEELLVGLVPVRGRVVDYKVVEIEGRDWIVHRRLFEQLDKPDLPERPLYVVGVAEQGSFRKDLRRILFSNARFRVLVRMGQEGLRDTWTPVKLAHVIEPVVPDLASQLNSFGPEMMAAISDGAAEADSGAELQQQLGQRAMVSYAERLAARNDYEMDATDLRELESITEEYSVSFDTAPRRQQAFSEVDSFLNDRFGWPTDPEAEAECRSDALQESGLDVFGQPALPAATHETLSALPTSDSSSHGGVATSVDGEERYLDSEIVAIYW